MSTNLCKKRFKDRISNSIDNIDIFEDGFVKGLIIHNPSRDEDLPDYYELTAIHVEPAFKNSGIGSQLISKAEQIAKEKGFKNLMLWVLDGNIRAINFYKKHGYKCDGQKKFHVNWNAGELRLTKKL